MLAQMQAQCLGDTVFCLIIHQIASLHAKEIAVPYRYRGIINVDFTNSRPNEYTLLRVALRHDGWTQVETSAYIRDADDINDLWRGFGLVARQSAAIGILSALTFHIQGSLDFSTNTEMRVGRNPEIALNTIRNKPFPD